jgi:hypothetical protein
MCVRSHERSEGCHSCRLLQSTASNLTPLNTCVSREHSLSHALTHAHIHLLEEQRHSFITTMQTNASTIESSCTNSVPWRSHTRNRCTCSPNHTLIRSLSLCTMKRNSVGSITRSFTHSHCARRNTTCMQWGKNQIMMSCAAKVGFDWATLDACGTGAEGQHLMERSSSMSNERHITCVASIIRFSRISSWR